MDILSQNLFSLHVYAADLPDFEKHVPALVARIEELREDDRGIQASNRHAFHSLRDFHLADDESTRWLRESILLFVTEALGPQIKSDKPWEIRIAGCWAIAVGAGGFLVPHNHFPDPWSGVVYLSAEHALEGDSHESAEGCLSLLCPLPLPEAFGLSENTIVHPRDGLAVLFPGALQHTVHPHRSEKTRYSVAFNAFVKAM